VSTTTGGAQIYWKILRRRTVLAPFSASSLARLTIPMTPLGIILLVHSARGSYALAGFVTGAYALGVAVGSPVLGRAMDREGQSRVVRCSAVVSAALLASLALLADAGAPFGVLAAVAAAGGATCPPLTAAMRVTWRLVLDTEQEQRAGYAVDAASQDGSYIIGPLLLSLLLVLTPPVGPLLITAGVLAVGALAYSVLPPARVRTAVAGPGGPTRHHLLLRDGAVVAVLVAGACLSIGLGTVDTSLTAAAMSVLHDPGELGYLFAPIAAGSVVGGLVYGAIAGREDERRRAPVLLGLFGAGLGLLALLMSHGPAAWWVLAPALLVVGLVISPNLIILQNLLDELVSRTRQVEAQAWMSTSVTVGVAGGNALAGWLIDRHGVPGALAGGTVVVGFGGLVAVACQSMWRTRSSRMKSAPRTEGVP
jgi:MFS family permease